MDCLRIFRPDDFHVHFREGEMLKKVVGYTAEYFGRALVMPNTNKPILSAEDAHAYEEKIKRVLHPDQLFEPMMTIRIAPSTTPQIIEEARNKGVIAGKLYPDGVTTNSEDGVRDFRALDAVFEKMQSVGMVLSIHGEMPDTFCLDREAAFLPILEDIATSFPRLKIVLEHITTSEAVWVVQRLPNVAATITVHHLCLTLDDVVGNTLQPHHFCKPLAKRPKDRAALVSAATSGSEKFFFGSDSAPHPRDRKECAHGCAGVFTAPVALGLLAEIFEQADALDKLERFTSINGANFYGLCPPNEIIEMVKQHWEVLPEYNGIVPFKAGEVISWKPSRAYHPNM